MTQHRIKTTSEHRRDCRGEQRRRAVADGVHPAVKEVEAPDTAPILDRVAVETGREQLRLTDHPMLPSRQSGDPTIGCDHSLEIIATR
jgi:hypothetical protein